MFVVDNSVWVSRFIEDELDHEVSRDWLERCLRAGGLLIEPVLLLVELSGAIARRTGEAEHARETAERLTGLRSIKFMPLDRRLGAMATRLAADGRLRGADAVYVAVAERLGIPLVTWDREQGQRAAAFIRVGTPAEIDPVPSAPVG